MDPGLALVRECRDLQQSVAVLALTCAYQTNYGGVAGAWATASPRPTASSRPNGSRRPARRPPHPTAPRHSSWVAAAVQLRPRVRTAPRRGWQEAANRRA